MEVSGINDIRKRATVIVSTPNGIVLVSHSRRDPSIYMLPGGGVRKDERSIDAAVRELYEETGLHSLKTKHLFDIQAKHSNYKVYKVKPSGTLRKRSETTHIRFYNNKTKNRYKLAWHVEPVIKKYRGSK